MAAKANIKCALSDDKKHLGAHAIQNDDASFDVSYRGLEETSSYSIDIESVSDPRQTIEDHKQSKS